MTILHKTRLHNNHNIQIINNGGNFTANGGLSLVSEYLDKLGFSKLINHQIHFDDSRKFNQHSNSDILLQILFQLIAGYKNDSSANFLQNDPALKVLFNKKKLASQPTVSRFLKRVTQDNITEFSDIIQYLVDLVLEKNNQQEMIIDVDSTHTDTYGYQENANFNAHYQTNGYHPLIAFDGMTGMLLATKLRPGNVYTSNGIVDFINPILSHYRNHSCDMNILVRGDSGFSSGELYQSCDDQKCKFLIKLKANTKLQNMAEHNVQYGNVPIVESSKIQYFELKYQPDTWAKPYRVVLKAVRPAGELFFSYEFLVTNLYSIDITDVFKMYHNRGIVENSIKEIKDGFFMNKTDSHSFRVNTVRTILSSLAFNIVQSMKCLALPATESCKQINTLRLQLFRIPAKIIRHSRSKIIQLSRFNVYDRLFWRVLERIEMI
ncbi:IS1380 family transposase [Companilactobacillus futsaii]|uniref:IS1380 family transposase n=1 Tax=Companilactobacillus futsaii TaxID=938155 RepID=UPI00189DDD90|nr:IS1380 family transposase [Companilactobacillus futsaii]